MGRDKRARVSRLRVALLLATAAAASFTPPASAQQAPAPSAQELPPLPDAWERPFAEINEAAKAANYPLAEARARQVMTSARAANDPRVLLEA
ncbi:MAG TPA: hypothetical protein VEZ41_08570, partial [Allosphingosinicella sp.]|nr:hypothetical protein [Allosphingosinicella sp.]